MKNRKKEQFSCIATHIVLLVLLLYSENLIAWSLLHVAALDRFWQGNGGEGGNRGNDSRREYSSENIGEGRRGGRSGWGRGVRKCFKGSCKALLLSTARTKDPCVGWIQICLFQLNRCLNAHKRYLTYLNVFLLWFCSVFHSTLCFFWV